MRDELLVSIGLPAAIFLIGIIEYMKNRYDRTHGRGEFKEAVVIFFATTTIVLFALSVLSIWVFCVLRTLGIISD